MHTEGNWCLRVFVLSEEVHFYMDAFKDDFLSESCSECLKLVLYFVINLLGVNITNYFIYIPNLPFMYLSYAFQIQSVLVVSNMHLRKFLLTGSTRLWLISSWYDMSDFLLNSRGDIFSYLNTSINTLLEFGFKLFQYNMNTVNSEITLSFTYLGKSCPSREL